MPVADGVPVIAPVLVLRFSPVGNVPTDNDQVRGAVPPVDARICEYAVPDVAPGSDDVVIEGAAATTMESG